MTVTIRTVDGRDFTLTGKAAEDIQYQIFYGTYDRQFIYFQTGQMAHHVNPAHIVSVTESE